MQPHTHTHTHEDAAEKKNIYMIFATHATHAHTHIYANTQEDARNIQIIRETCHARTLTKTATHHSHA